MKQSGTIGISPLGSFSWALLRLKDGGKMRRIGWNNKDVYIELQKPNENSKTAYIFMKRDKDNFVAWWVPSQTDMLEDDWEDYVEKGGK